MTMGRFKNHKNKLCGGLNIADRQAFFIAQIMSKLSPSFMLKVHCSFAFEKLLAPTCDLLTENLILNACF